MKRLKSVCLSIILIIGSTASITFCQTKWAQTGFNFLNVSSDAKSGAMGDAVNSLSGYSGALFHNPATMAEMPSFFSSTFSINNWIADIKYLQLSAIFSPFNGDYGVLGFSLQSIDYGDVLGTMNWNNEKGYIDTGILNPSALAIGIGYAKMISDRFGVGGQVKFAYQELGKSTISSVDNNSYQTKRNLADAVAFDFGTIFKTGVQSLAFGMSVRNFSKEIKFEQEGFQLPLIFTIGISANLFDFVEIKGPEQSFILSVDATHPRSHPEQVKVGAEYSFLKIISLRGGYITGDSEDDVTFGLGISSSGMGISALNFEIDYSYTPFGVFDNVQRFTARLSL
ncbi:MAG TPA: PorV/PorQ family protein [Ignavibacteriaceae bacterium]|nr:PorV/PorQ family protein [Ignavibacteriaceae bacterium]